MKKNTDFSHAKINAMQARKFALTVLTLVFTHCLLLAQSTGSSTMTGNGKLYVVVAVILTVFVGIIFFLLFLDRRLTKIENQIKDDA
ncbi:MAG: CcmD family protein [Lewinella sp.]|nr:CcmD family protein [Lewinella sp.]